MTGTENKHCSFEYEGKIIHGHVVSSTTLEPHFHWFMFDEPSVIEQYGDSIAFKMQAGKLVPLYHLTSPGFVNAVQECVERYLQLK